MIEKVCKYLELISKMIFNINLRKLPSQYGEISVMLSVSAVLDGHARHATHHFGLNFS